MKTLFFHSFRSHRLFFRLSFQVLAPPAQSTAISTASRVDRLEREVGGLKTEVAGLKTEVAGLKTEVAGLKTEVAGLKRQVSALQEILEKVLNTLHGVLKNQKPMVPPRPPRSGARGHSGSL